MRQSWEACMDCMPPRMCVHEAELGGLHGCMLPRMCAHEAELNGLHGCMLPRMCAHEAELGGLHGLRGVPCCPGTLMH
eukprot:364774-Chlamydomonas_euryale.AAC.2